ncbi:MAG: hypothetical protein M3O67_04100, partial [Bacteroidota bacterium]|nr:hypothetical protein [Bacteroidota bacterium]
LTGIPVVNSQVDGVYDPYFTPANQVIHSLLASATIHFSKTVNFTSRVSIGVVAHADNPILLEDRNPVNQYFINKTYSDLKYTPAEFVNDLRFQFSERFFLNADYTYSSLIFYKSHQANIQLKYLFINGKN